MDYQTLKLLHILGACLFVGNNLVTPFWRFFAERTRDAKIIAWSQRLITLTDFVFTGGGIALLLGAGHVMAAQVPHFWQLNWFVWAYALFALSGVIWICILLPIQIKQAKMVRDFPIDGEVPAEFWALSKRWNVAGSLASALPIASLVLMVLK